MKTIQRVLGAFMLFTLVLAACRAQPTEAPPAPTEAPAEPEEPEEPEEPAEVGPIKIGFMGPLSGGAAFLGQEQLNFAKVAVDIFNEETGMDVEIVEGDTEINPDTAKVVAERFVADEDIYAVVGPAGSQVCEATQPVFADAGLAHITPSCTRISLTDPGTATFFRPIPHDGAQGPTDARYMVEVLGATSAYLVDDQSSYAVGLTDELASALEGMGVSDIERASVTQEDTDFSSIVTAVLAAGSEVVFFPGQISSQLGTLAVQLREQGYAGTYFLADGGFDISWVDVAGDAGDGTYVSFFAPDPHFVAEADPYTSRYQDEYGDFGAFGGPSALGARIALEAIQRCVDGGDLSRACVRDEIAATNMSPSLLGVPVSFGAGNQLEGGEFFIFQVQEGEFTLIQGDQPGIAPEVQALGTEENPIVWVLVPSQDTEAVLSGAEEIAAAFEEETGLVVTPLVTTDYTGAVEAMCNQEAHMGALNTFNYVVASQRGCAEVAVASVRFGSTFYSGQLITQADSGIESIADLAGKTFCRPDPTSTSGWVIPSIAMQAEGIDPENDLEEIVDAGGHDAVVIAVYNGDCDAGSTFVDARGNVEEEFADVMDVVVVIAESAPIPNDNISYAPSVPAAVRDGLTGVLLDLASTDEGLEILNTVYSWSGMEVVEDSFYDGFRQQLEAAGVDIEELAG